MECIQRIYKPGLGKFLWVTESITGFFVRCCHGLIQPRHRAGVFEDEGAGYRSLNRIDDPFGRMAVRGAQRTARGSVAEFGDGAGTRLTRNDASAA